MVQMISISNKCCSFERSIFIIYIYKNSEKMHHKNMKQHNCFQYWYFVYWAANQHIRMISEGSCDTEDWSNDAENSTLHQKNELHFKMY